MNLKNNYLKDCWSRPIKNKIILILAMLHLLKKTKKNTWRYHYFTPMIYSSWDIEHDGLKLVILGHFLPFYSPKHSRKQNFEKMKKIAGDIIILLVRTKNQNHMMHGSWDTEWDRQNFFVILGHFWPSPAEDPEFKIFKNWKKQLAILSFYTYFTHVHHKWKSFNV